MDLTNNFIEASNEASETLRRKVKLPKLPNNTDELKNLPEMNMHRSEMINGELLFRDEQDFDGVLKNGFFLLKIPELMNLQTSDKFVNNFYKEKNNTLEDNYKGFKHVKILNEYQGYFDRPNDQWENFYIERSNWSTFLPSDVSSAGLMMATLGIEILKNVFRKISIPESCWDKVSGGLTACKGHQMLAFNHFRPEREMRGTKLHRDSGWVTVLRSTEPGLVALVDDKLYAVNPVEGYFIINFGSSMEVLTSKLPTPIRANIHGVVKTLQKSNHGGDRTSYVIFLDSDLSSWIYAYENGYPRKIQLMKDFAMQEVNRTYDDREFL